MIWVRAASIKKIYLCLMVSLGLWSCSLATTTATAEVTKTATPTPYLTQTPTVVWFPPTATYTLFPTPIITPTVDMRPKIGKIIYEDDFSQKDQWALGQSESGSVALGKNELSVAISETNAYLFSVRENPILIDFYLEITTSPSLCRNLDEYGVLFRVSSEYDYYRLSLSCNGQVRLDRLVGGNADSLQPWMLSGAVPPGAPSSSRIGVAAKGHEMRIFINGQYQFSVNDRLLESGGIGVFARSTEKKAVTVNFSHLTVYEIEP